MRPPILMKTQSRIGKSYLPYSSLLLVTGANHFDATLVEVSVELCTDYYHKLYVLFEKFVKFLNRVVFCAGPDRSGRGDVLFAPSPFNVS